MEPSAIWSISMEGPALVIELSTIWGLCVEGSALDIEPSMMRGVFVEGSGLENGTFHGFGPQRGWFRPTACFAQQLRANTRDRGYCRWWLRTGFAGRAPGPGYNMHLIACLRPKDGKGCKSPLQRPAASIICQIALNAAQLFRVLE